MIQTGSSSNSPAIGNSFLQQIQEQSILINKLADQKIFLQNIQQQTQNVQQQTMRISVGGIPGLGDDRIMFIIDSQKHKNVQQVIQDICQTMGASGDPANYVLKVAENVQQQQAAIKQRESSEQSPNGVLQIQQPMANQYQSQQQIYQQLSQQILTKSENINSAKQQYTPQYQQQPQIATPQYSQSSTIANYHQPSQPIQIPKTQLLSTAHISGHGKRGRPRIIKPENDPKIKNEPGNNQQERVILTDQVNYFRMNSLKIRDPNFLFEEIQQRCINMIAIVDIICIKSQEAYHLNEKDSEPGDCEFKLEYSKRDETEFYQLSKFVLQHSHPMDQNMIVETRIQKLNTPYLIQDKEEESVQSNGHYTESNQPKSVNFFQNMLEVLDSSFYKAENNQQQTSFQPFIMNLSLEIDPRIKGKMMMFKEFYLANSNLCRIKTQGCKERSDHWSD
ncbi:UNKNOWN [Stylonychia lemnae]|uniref:Uncharacterized protein n=1 Tax=Stylonychia lemnae TaxID=5949 RepID=A0A078B7P6_STYLE|nr:UNKNOWN [Stylonychia lemnae]|eukprot:CDW90399.1 UNKNOWN [Stylonychia lemnae]